MTRRGKIHAIAICRECAWTEGDYKLARMAAYNHHMRTGHIVDVEIGSWITYGE